MLHSRPELALRLEMGTRFLGWKYWAPGGGAGPGGTLVFDVVRPPAGPGL